MKIYMFISCLLLVFIFSFSMPIQYVQANGDSAIEQEIKVLRNEFIQMKKDYEQRIRTLEEKLAERREKAPVHKAAPVGSYGGIMNPDVSVIANIQANLTEDKTDANRDKVRAKESEIALQGYLYPGIRGDVIAALEQEYEEDGSGTSVHTHTHLEEAYISFLELPFGLQAELGRKFLNFGRLNPIHAHHWSFVDKPLVLENFFGEEAWNDDGVLVSALIPNSWDLYLKTTLALYNGKDPGSIDWNGHVYFSRTNTNVSFGENADLDLGYSWASEKGQNTTLQGFDSVFTYRWPMSYKKLKWQNEVLFSDIDTLDTESWGAYSLAKLTLDKNWEIGARYDWSQTLTDDQNHEWAISPFLTYYLTESFYVRGQYRHRKLTGGHEPENAYFLQCVWGLGPHSHRLED